MREKTGVVQHPNSVGEVPVTKKPAQLPPAANAKAMQPDIAALIGRIGPQAAIVLRSRKAGPMADRRTRRNRTRADQKRRAVSGE
jgi:hypothetical protein